MVNRIEVIKDFITEEEQAELVAHAHSLWDTGLRRRERHTVPGQKGERRSHKYRDCPDWLMQRFQETLGIPHIWRTKLIMHELGGLTGTHCDIQTAQNHRRQRAVSPTTYRANLLVQAAEEGGHFYIDEDRIDMPSRSLLHFVGNNPHFVSAVEKGDRIMITNFYKPA